MLSKVEKIELRKQFEDKLDKAQSIVLFVYKGISVDKVTKMRATARQLDVELKVVKNNVLKKALDDTNFSELSACVSNQAMVALSYDELSSPARLVKKVNKDLELKLEVLGICLGDNVLLESDQLDLVAKLPSLPEARAQLLSVMQAPISKLVRTLNECNGKFVKTVAAYAQSLEESN